MATLSTVELFSTLRNLPRLEKLKVMQFLILELAKEEDPSLEQGAVGNQFPTPIYPVWSPLNSHEAAHKLAQLLEEDKQIHDA